MEETVPYLCWFNLVIFQLCDSSKATCRTSLVVQWLRPHSSTAGSTGSIHARGTKILKAEQCRKQQQQQQQQQTNRHSVEKEVQILNCDLSPG